MKKFIFKITVYLFFLGSIALLVFSFADGSIDGEYGKFTSAKQSSLIIGTSKASQGLKPQILNKTLPDFNFYNYAFNLGQSPFGPAYLKSIKRKLDTTYHPKIFIVTVDPYSISDFDGTGFRENRSAVGQITNVNSDLLPNLNYLINHYNNRYVYLITKKFEFVNNDFVHKNGWFEVEISMDSQSIAKRKEKKLLEYSKNKSKYKFSEGRYLYLQKTISYLKEHGLVFIVRLPVSSEFLEMENSIVENFDYKIKQLSNEFSVKFLDMTKEDVDQYQYTDGNHLYKSSSTEVTNKIGNWIDDHQN